MAKAYHTFDLLWQERTIAVSYQANWLNSGQWHIELRSDTRLPVTATGYRSIFVPPDRFQNEAEIEPFIQAMLDQAAQTSAWQTYVEDSRQLSLF